MASLAWWVMTAPPNPEPAPTRPRGPNRLPALGSRGGGWVALQVVLFAAAGAAGLLGGGWPERARPWLWLAGGAAGVGGVALALLGGAGLGSQLTPFPRPVAAGELRQDGVYGLVRHPIYGGVLLILLGWSLLTSPAALVTFALAIVFFEAKRRREEAWLLDAHPDYADYRARVPRRFLPYLW